MLRHRHRKEARQKVGLSLPLLTIFIVLTGAGVGWSMASQDNAEAVLVPFGLCHTGARINCVVDGDTIWLNGEKIRIADIDTPETHSPRCAREADLGDRATRRLHALLNSGPFTVEPYGERNTDRYGRQLRVMTRDGQSLGQVLVEEGLARPWDGERRPWC